MVQSDKPYNPSDEIEDKLKKLSKGFEYYLPDEKISQVWQETELISTGFPEFEAVYFERELEDGKLFISIDLEFFPVYMLHLATKYGKPKIILEGTFEGSDLINLPAGSHVIVVGFVKNDENLKKVLPPVEEPVELDMIGIEIMAEPYLQEILE